MGFSCLKAKLAAITKLIANGSNTNTIIRIKNFTTSLSGTLNASATNLNPPTSLSKLMLLFLIELNLYIVFISLLFSAFLLLLKVYYLGLLIGLPPLVIYFGLKSFK